MSKKAPRTADLWAEAATQFRKILLSNGNDCPSLKTQSLKDCVCDPIVPAPTRLDP